MQSCVTCSARICSVPVLRKCREIRIRQQLCTRAHLHTSNSTLVVCSRPSSQGRAHPLITLRKQWLRRCACPPRKRVYTRNYWKKKTDWLKERSIEMI